MKTRLKLRKEKCVHRATGLACLALALTLAAGCGTGTYNDAYDARLSELTHTSATTALWADKTDDLPVNFRVPKAFVNAWAINSKDPHDESHRIPRQEVLPPFLMDPTGFRRTYQVLNIEAPQLKTPLYLYVWMYDAPTPKEGYNNVRDSLRTILHDSSADWEPVKATTLDGQTRNWKRLRLKGDQMFEIARVSGNTDNFAEESKPGVFELWLFETPGWDVMLGWRATTETWDNGKWRDLKFQDLPLIVAGSIDAPAASKRNMNPLPAGPAVNIAPADVAGSSNPQPDAGQTTPNVASNVKFASREYMVASGSTLAFSAVFPDGWVERFGIAYLPDKKEERKNFNEIDFARFPPDSRLGKLMSGDILRQIEEGSNVEKGTFEMGGKQGEFRLVRVDFAGNRRPELAGFYIIHFDAETVAFVIYGYADDTDKFKSAIKTITGSFRIESIAMGGGPAAPPGAERDRTYIGLTSKDRSQPFSFKFPADWRQEGMSAVPLRAEADDSADTLELGVTEVPETVSSEQLYTESKRTAGFNTGIVAGQFIESGPVKVLDLDGWHMIADGVSNAKASQRKLIYYCVRKGPLLVSFKGDFDATKFDAMKPQFEEFVNSFRFEGAAAGATPPAAGPPAATTPAGAAPADASTPVKPADASVPAKPADASTPTKPADPSAPTTGIAPFTGEPVKFAIQFPAGWTVASGIGSSSATAGAGADPALAGVSIVATATVLPVASFSLKSIVDSLKAGPQKLIDSGELAMEGQEAIFIAMQHEKEGKSIAHIEYSFKKGNKFGSVKCDVPSEAYDKVKDVVKQCAMTFRFDDAAAAAAPPANASNPIAPPVVGGSQPAAAIGIVPEAERHHNEKAGFSIRFPVGWHPNASPDYTNAVFTGSSEDPNLIGASLAVKVSTASNVNFQKVIDAYEARGPKNPSGAGIPSGPYQVIERGDTTIGGQPAAFFVASYTDRKESVYAQYMVNKGARLAVINYHTAKESYPKLKELYRQSIETFQFDPLPGDAPVPAAGAAAAAAPGKPERVDIELPDGVTGSIEFPAGFQHTGKSPEASTVPPMPAGGGAATEQPDTIKVQVNKLGPGTSFNMLRQQTLNSESQGAPNKILERGGCSIAGQSGEYFVFAGSQPAAGANQAARKRIIFMASVPAKHLAVEIIAEMADANYKTLKEPLKLCVRSLKFE